MTDTKLFSEESERIVLATLLQHPDTIYVSTNLTVNAFSSVSNRLIFVSVKKLVEDGLTPDSTLVTEYLKSRGKLDKAGGDSYIKGLYKQDVNPDNIKQYINVVIDSYKAKSLLSISAKIPDMVYTSDSPNVVIDYVKGSLNNLLLGSGGDRTMSIKDVVKHQWEIIQERTKVAGIAGYKTGYLDLDQFINGANAGDLIVVAGRPSQGKTMFICNSALKCGNPSLIFSKEMGTGMLMDRLISAESQIPFTDIRQGTFKSQDDVNKIADTVDKLKGKDIFIDTNYSSDLSYILNTIRKYNMQYGIKFVYLDYVQLMVERDNNATHEIGRVSRALKLIANELDIVVFLVSQLNRGVEMRDNKRPILSDLRQSGNLEEDADIVLFLYRDDYYYPDSDMTGQIEVIVRKNRNGPIGKIIMKVISDTVTITEM